MYVLILISNTLLNSCVVTFDGRIIYVPTMGRPYKDSCGNTLGANVPIDPDNIPTDIFALIHTHPNWAAGWPAAGDYTSAQKYDVYNINPGGTWVLRRGAARGSAPIRLSGRVPDVPRGGTKCR